MSHEKNFPIGSIVKVNDIDLPMWFANCSVCIGLHVGGTLGRFKEIEVCIKVNDTFKILSYSQREDVESYVDLFSIKDNFTVSLYAHRLGKEFIKVINYNKYWAKLNE